MQPLNERQGIEIERPDMVELRLSFGGLDRFATVFIVTPSPVYFYYVRRALFSRRYAGQ